MYPMTSTPSTRMAAEGERARAKGPSRDARLVIQEPLRQSPLKETDRVVSWRLGNPRPFLLAKGANRPSITLQINVLTTGLIANMPSFESPFFPGGTYLQRCPSLYPRRLTSCPVHSMNQVSKSMNYLLFSAQNIDISFSLKRVSFSASGKNPQIDRELDILGFTYSLM